MAQAVVTIVSDLDRVRLATASLHFGHRCRPSFAQLLSPFISATAVALHFRGVGVGGSTSLPSAVTPRSAPKCSPEKFLLTASICSRVGVGACSGFLP